MYKSMNKSSGYWQEINFVPAPEGWRVAYKNSGGLLIRPLSGWLTQKWVPTWYKSAPGEDDPPFGDIQIVPVDCSEGFWEPVKLIDSDFLCILHPGQDSDDANAYIEVNI